MRRPVGRTRIRYRYRIRFAGLLYLAMTLLLGVAAATRPNNLLVWIFGVMLGAILVSGVVSGFMLMRLEVRRVDRAPSPRRRASSRGGGFDPIPVRSAGEGASP